MIGSITDKRDAVLKRYFKECTNRGAYILGSGAVFGEIYSTEEMLKAFHCQRKVVGDTKCDKDFADRVFKKCGFNGHSVTLSKEDLFRTMSRDEYVALRRSNLVELARKACEKALQDWGGDRKSITHLFWGTMTGAMDSPTIDILLARCLNLNLDVQRTSIEGMGCLTGFRLLNLARGESLADPDSRILVIEADLRSALGNSMPDKVSRADIVAVSLFRDAASAAVVGGNVFGMSETPCYEIICGASRIVHDAHDLVEYHETNGGSIRLHLSKHLPSAVGQAEPSFVRDLLGKARMVLKDNDNHMSVKLPCDMTCFDFACHTGGPRVLKEVAQALKVSDDHFASSWAIMQAYGNLSGASNLSVLDHQNKRGGRDWVVCLSMGPGVCLEGTVLRRVKNDKDLLSRRSADNLKSLPLGDPEVEIMVNKFITKKIVQGHVSSQYPSMWMSKSISLKQNMRSFFKWLVPGLFLGALLMVIYYDRSDNTRLPLACVLLVSTTTSLVVAISSLFTPDQVTLLSFVGVMIMFFGASTNVFFASKRTMDDDGIENNAHKALATTIGFSLLTLGAQIFSMASFVFQPWEMMLGNFLLPIGMGFHASASLIRCIKSHDDNEPTAFENAFSTAALMDVVAIPFFFVALFLVGKRAFIDLRRPFLCPPNFVFYGVILFGLGEVFSGSALAITTLVHNGFGPFWLSTFDTMARGLLFIATLLLLLAAAITAFNLDRTVEYCYPATTMLVSASTVSIGLHRFAGFVVTLGGIIGFIHTAATYALKNPSTFEMNAPTGIISGILSLVMYKLVFLNNSNASRRNVLPSFKPMYFKGGFFLLGSAYLLRCISSFMHEDDHKSLRICACIVGVFGAATHTTLGLLLPMGQWAVTPWKPFSYTNSLHPGNYFFLASLSHVLAFVSWFFEEQIIGNLMLVISGMLFSFLLSMTLHVHDMLHCEGQLRNSPIEEDDTDAEDTSDRSGAEPSGSRKVVEVDVVIVGSGPTGLLLASILGKQKISVMLAEARSKPIEDARFTVINSASMEHLAQILDPDVFAELRFRAMPDSTPFGSMLTSGLGHDDATVLESCNTPSRKTLTENMGNLCDTSESRSFASKHAAALPIRANQSHQEEVLKKQAEKYDTVNVLYGHRLLHFKTAKHSMYGSCVVSRICPCGSEDVSDTDLSQQFTVKSRFIVGADGPRSTVAKGLGINFDGFLNVGSTRSLLVKAPGLYEKVLSRLGGTFMYQIFRPKFGLAGIVAADPKKELWNFLMIIGDKTKDATADEICKEFLGTTNFEPIQDRPWRWNFFMARNFRRGPGFLAGDAAHSWPPFGAIGGNSGFGDAINLGWKLAAVCKGLGGDTLLDSYATERRQQALQTAMYVMSLTPRPQLLNKYIIPHGNSSMLMRWFRAMWYFANSGKNNGNHFSQDGVQLGMHFNYSPVLCSEHPLTDDPWCAYLPIIRAGSRLPYCNVHSADDPTLQIGVYDLVASSGYTLFHLIPDTETDDAQWKDVSLDTANALIQYFAHVSVPLRVIRDIDVATLRHMSVNSSDGRSYTLDLWENELLILVRPDNIVAWHMSKLNANKDLFGLGWNSDHSGFDLTARCKVIVELVTGLSVEDCPNHTAVFERNEKHHQMTSYQTWLTKQFLFNIRPYGFLFPTALPICNETKEQAMQNVRGKMSQEGGKQHSAVAENIDFTTRNHDIIRQVDH